MNIKILIARPRITKRYIRMVFCVTALVGICRSPVLQVISEEPASHQEIRKFAFAKNHKCGSSTIENIIFRFANDNKLNLVIPLKGAYLSREQLFNHTLFLKQVRKAVSYDIFSLHSRWNHKEVMAVLEEKVPAFTVIRNPVDAFISLFHYLSPVLGRFFGAQDIHEMVHIVQEVPSRSIFLQRLWGLFGRNQLAWDLGLSPFIYENQTAMQKEIERLDSEFDLVMISDRMDESLILLKDLLHWPVENIVHLDLNKRKPGMSPTLSGEERNILSKWLSADVQIFKYFSRRFDERIAELNKKHYRLWDTSRQTFIEKETEILKKENKRLYDRCVVEEVGSDKISRNDLKWYGGSLISGYLINEEKKECAAYSMNQQSFLRKFKRRLKKPQKKRTDK